VQDPLGHVTAYTYEPAYFGVAHLTRTTWPDGATDAQTWGLNGRVATRTDPFGRITQFGYDVEGNVISVVDTLNQLTGFTYDELGRRLTHTDANSRTTHTAYDARGNIIRRTLPLGQSEHFTYDAGGNVLTHTDFNGDTTIFTYDCLGRLTGKTLPDGATVGYTYDAVDNVVSHTDAVGTTTYTYDRRDRLTAVTDPTGVTLSYTYDDAGNRLTLTGPGGTTQYAYDAANRLTAVTDPDGNTTQYTYDAAGRRTGVLHANGTATTYTYDARHRLTALEHRDAGNALLARYEYQLDAAGKRTRLTESTGRTVDYQYDALGRLVRVDDVLGPVTLTTEHTYDAVGNRVSATRQGQTQTYLYDANNRLTALLAADTFTYDANGNLLSHTRDGQTTTYSYDGQNRLVQVTEPVGNVTVNRYDDAGLRVATIVNGTTTQFVWDRAHPSGLPQIVAELDDTGNVLNRYTYGDDRISLHTGGQTYAYHYDGMGSTRLLTDAGGAIAARYQFDAWGNLMSSSGSVPNPFLYTGEQFDPNAGFYYLRARFYDPVHGRFVSADSHPGSVYDPPSLHKYLYAHADPVNHVDPTGRFTLLVITINLGIKQAIKGSHVLALASSYGYQLYSKGKITIPAALAADLYERLQTARLNETLTLDDLRLDGEPDPDPDSIVQLDRQYGRGAIASVFLTSHSLMGAGSSESFIMPFVDGVQTWIASLPIVDEKPGHYHNCAFNGWAARVVSLNLINFPFFARATTRKMAGVQVALSGLGTLMAYTVGDSVASVAPMGPPDGVCHNVSLPGAGG
jgi:RHS repeat-associated protein